MANVRQPPSSDTVRTSMPAMVSLRPPEVVFPRGPPRGRSFALHVGHLLETPVAAVRRRGRIRLI
jgi:hypothetical protein